MYKRQGYIYVKIKGKDTWCHDGVDYTLTPSLNQDNRDTDEDGFGDVPMGAKRDDCPDTPGTSTRDVQGCKDSDGDGWSDEYGGWNAAFSIMGEEPASSWLSYMILGTVMLLSSGLAMIVRYSRSVSSLEKGVIKENNRGGDSNA